MRFRLFVEEEYKPMGTVPKWVYVFLALALSTQLTFHSLSIKPKPTPITEYGTPLPYSVAKILSFGDNELASKFLVLRIQAFDNQPGVSIPFRDLDYFELSDWLNLIVKLDEKSEYPHFLMSKIYSQVVDVNRQYIAVEWVRKQFANRPNERWEWMVHITTFVKHFLHNDELALAYASELRAKTDPHKVPSWVRQIELFFIENDGQFEAAAAILAKQLESGYITEPHEFAFSLDRLEQLVTTMLENGEIKDKSEWDEKIKKIESLKSEYLLQHGI